jgi:mRNA-degrading endonuclease toxin of MazEF toxin-antitoxin module
MKYSDIKPKNIYYVDFEPTKGNEFRGNHLALVLKLNKDKRTVVVLPLTSSPSGVGGNKISLGFIASLPANLKSSETFAVLDQMRTVDYARFKQIDEKGKPIFPNIPDKLYLDIWVSISNETLFNITLDDKKYIYETLYFQALGKKIQDLAYNIIKERKKVTYVNNISSIEAEIIAIINSAPYWSWESHVNKDVGEIIRELLKKALTN